MEIVSKSTSLYVQQCCGKKCFKLWCVLSAVQCTALSILINVLTESALNRCAVQPFTESDDTRCFVTTIFPPEDGHVNARNMSRIIV